MMAVDACRNATRPWSAPVAMWALVGSVVALTLASPRIPAESSVPLRRGRRTAVILALLTMAPFALSALHLTGPRFWDHLRCPD